ncbi:STAS domain-containing protein [Amycolatopsis pigmentata]|uniref:STAS domain-containing protein n=1 Tax=Amycolatopsis pigmentata TaxID=450801 RepID=A0ABW5FXG4_9PSEU
MKASLTLTSSRKPDGTVVLTAEGEIDMTNSADFATAIEEALPDATGSLVVDLTEVDYLDSAGLTVLLNTADRVEIIATPLLAPVLTICGLTELTKVHGIEQAERTS